MFNMITKINKSVFTLPNYRMYSEKCSLGNKETLILLAESFQDTHHEVPAIFRYRNSDTQYLSSQSDEGDRRKLVTTTDQINVVHTVCVMVLQGSQRRSVKLSVGMRPKCPPNFPRVGK